MKNFIAFTLQNGVLHTLSNDAFPAAILGIHHGAVSLAAQKTHMGFVQKGNMEITSPQGTFLLKKGMYFSIPGEATLQGGEGIVISQHNFEGFFTIGGPIEQTGRLRYIDGCTDSLLIAPPLMGDPCLNLLHIPAGTYQSAHTHPSFRVGIIVSGKGICRTPEGDYPLHAGLPFLIPAQAEHSFITNQSEPLRVIAYHPDSDFGPTAENHPMINRTYLTQNH